MVEDIPPAPPHSSWATSPENPLSGSAGGWCAEPGPLRRVAGGGDTALSRTGASLITRSDSERRVQVDTEAGRTHECNCKLKSSESVLRV